MTLWDGSTFLIVLRRVARTLRIQPGRINRAVRVSEKKKAALGQVC